jgi:hypothetical protein
MQTVCSEIVQMLTEEAEATYQAEFTVALSDLSNIVTHFEI